MNINADIRRLGDKKSHKYFSEFILKSFYSDKSVVCLNAKTGKQITESSKTFNTRIGYYTNDVEEILNTNFEQAIANMSRDITKFVRRGKRQNTSALKIEPEIIYRFFAYQILRNPALCSAFFERLPIDISTLSMQSIQNDIISQESRHNVISSALQEWFFPVVELNYSSPGLLSIDAPVHIKFEDGSMYVLIVNPKFAYCLVDKNIARYINIDPELRYAIRNDGEDCVAQINEHIMAHAIKYEPHFVLGRDFDYIKQLRNEIKIKINRFN